MRIGDVMTRNVRTTSPDASIQEAARAMAEIDVGILPVGEGDRLVGMITDRDIAVRAVAQGRGPDAKVREAMSDEVKYCFDDEEVADVARNMADIKVQRLPVMSRDKRLVGIVTLGDIAIRGDTSDVDTAVTGMKEPGGPDTQGQVIGVRAFVINCTLKPSPQPSNTDALAAVVVEALRGHGIEVEELRAVNHDIKPGVESDMGDGDAWPAIRGKVLAADILVVATPTWLGHPSSVAQRVLERMDAMLSETTEAGLPVAYNKVAGVIVTGNEDGAHHVIAEVAQGLIDIGFTVPGQAWTYWNMGPGPGPSYTETDRKHNWSAKTGRVMAANLAAVAQALKVTPIPPPPG